MQTATVLPRHPSSLAHHVIVDAEREMCPNGMGTNAGDVSWRNPSQRAAFLSRYAAHLVENQAFYQAIAPFTHARR